MGRSGLGIYIADDSDYEVLKGRGLLYKWRPLALFDEKALDEVLPW